MIPKNGSDKITRLFSEPIEQEARRLEEAAGPVEDTIIEDLLPADEENSEDAFARVMREAAERAAESEAIRSLPAIDLILETVTRERVEKALDGKKLIGYCVFLVDETGLQKSALLIPTDPEAAKRVVSALIAGLETRKFGLIHDHS